MAEESDTTAPGSGGAFDGWLRRAVSERQCLSPRPAAQLAGALGLDHEPDQGDPLPLPWHWIYFTPRPHAAATGEDGHPARGDFLPPISLPRRMWAGSRLYVQETLRLGEAVTKRSWVERVSEKTGRAGPLVFVTVVHEYLRGEGRLALREEQDIVYRGADSAVLRGRGRGRDDAGREPPQRPAAGRESPPSAAGDFPWQAARSPDPVLLFRYSALTFNAHRIHYDRAYARDREGYPDLVVQGPLIVTLLLDLAYRNDPRFAPQTVTFKARAPAFVGEELLLRGRQAQRHTRLEAVAPGGSLATEVEVTQR